MWYVVLALVVFLLSLFLIVLSNIKDYNFIPKPKFNYKDYVQIKYLKDDNKVYQVIDYQFNPKYRWYNYYIVNVHNLLDVVPNIIESDLEKYEGEIDEEQTNSTELS